MAVTDVADGRLHCRFDDAEALKQRSQALLAFRRFALQSALTHKVTHSFALSLGDRRHECGAALATAEGNNSLLHSFKPS